MFAKKVSSLIKDGTLKRREERKEIGVKLYFLFFFLNLFRDEI
jgi:hypothetical protein